LIGPLRRLKPAGEVGLIDLHKVRKPPAFAIVDLLAHFGFGGDLLHVLQPLRFFSTGFLSSPRLLVTE
jgi:hypothetical protein